MTYLLLFLGPIALPLCAGGLLLIISSRLGPRVGRIVALVAAGGAALSALILLPAAGDGHTPGVEWLPGTGSMTLGMEATSLAAAGVTALAAFLALLAPDAARRAKPRTSALILIALGAADAAFLAHHFLGRYVALEIAALCVALAPLLELGGMEGVRQSTGAYLILRLGDAGLLAAIAILAHAGGTLDIAPALAAGKTLASGPLAWTVAGLVLAVWVKQGMWPLHVWQHAGRRLSSPARAWLYAIVMPNLGAYLLYRVTSLLVLAGPLREAALWLGAGSAALAAWLALSGADVRAGLVDLGAAVGGLLLFVAASGLKPVVWLAVPALTLPRLLAYLAVDEAQKAASPLARRVAAALFALGGTAVSVFTVVAAGWARAGGAHWAAVWIVHVAAMGIAAWSVQTSQRLDQTAPPVEAESLPSRLAQWAGLALTGVLVLAGAAGGRPLGAQMFAAMGAAPPWLGEVPLGETAASLLAAAIVTGGAWLLRARVRERRPQQALVELHTGLSRTAHALREAIEVSLQERILGNAVRTIVAGSQWLYRAMEQQLLEDLIRHAARGVVQASATALRAVERESLERLLQRIVQGVRAWSRVLQRVHTGRLRVNLVWVAAALALAVVALVLLG